MHEQLPDWAPEDIDPSVPSVARIYDYVLGGGHHFASDRELARQLSETWPVVLDNMRDNRAFLRRSVNFLIDQGIDQFLDIGSGIPTAGNVHEILAARRHADAQVVYVDRDPVAVSHSDAILAGHPTAVAVRADFTDVDSIFSHPQVTGRLDLDRPVGLLLIALLHAVPDDADPWHTVARLRERIAPGSYVAATHPADEAPAEVVQRAESLSQQTTTPLTTRPKDQIARFFDGFDLVDPGLVYLHLWRPDDADEVSTRSDESIMYAGVGLRP